MLAYPDQLRQCDCRALIDLIHVMKRNHCLNAQRSKCVRPTAPRTGAIALESSHRPAVVGSYEHSFARLKALGLGKYAQRSDKSNRQHIVLADDGSAVRGVAPLTTAWR